MIVDKKIARILLEKEFVIGIPTDTVYGFAVKKGCEYKLYNLKKRNWNKKLISFSNKEVLKTDNLKIKEKALNWPGPLTLVFEVNGEFSSYRIPNQKDVISLVKSLDFEILTSSANESGMKPVLSKEEFLERFPGIPLLEESFYGVKSTVPSEILLYSRKKWIKLR